MKRFVVHDEDGPLRAFDCYDEATAFLQHLVDSGLKAYISVKPKPPKPPKPDINSLFEEAPF